MYLTPDERKISGGVLYKALKTGAEAWVNGKDKQACVRNCMEIIEGAADGTEAREKGVSIRVDYVEMNDADTFEVVRDEEVEKTSREGRRREAIILSGAIWVGKTRLIDNVILGDVGKIVV